MGKTLDSQLRGYASNPERMKKDPTFPIFLDGMKRGKQAVQYAVLTYLENKYIDDENRPDRGSPEAKNLLNLAKELAQFLRDLDLEAEVTK